MKYLFFLCCAILYVGCTENKTPSTESATSTKTSKPIVQLLENELNFIDSLPTWEPTKTYNTWLFHNNNREYYKILDEKTFHALQLENIYTQYDSTYTYYAYKQINFPQQFQSILVGKSNQNQTSMHMVNYSPQFEFLDSKLVHLYEEGRKLHASFLINAALYVDETEAYVSTKYDINENGHFIKSAQPVTFRWYHYPNFSGYLRDMPKRFVKQKEGILIKDAEGKPIRTAPFGEPLYIVDYQKDHKQQLSGALLQDGKVAKVVIDPNAVTQGKDFYIPTTNIGYIDTEGLFQRNPDYDTYDEETEEFGSYEFLSIGASGEYNVTVDLREIFEISKVTIDDYQDQIIRSPSDPNSLDIEKKGNTTLLTFKDGSSLQLKDTTYLNSEYTPTTYYHAFTHQDFENAYVVSESMFFADDNYYVLSMENGDTLHLFQGYPYLSPQKTHRVSVTSDFECIQMTHLKVSYLEGKTYKNYATVAIPAWSYPYALDEEQSPIDVFELYWLNEKEFIVKVKNPEDCDVGEEIDIFYLKYKIKL